MAKRKMTHARAVKLAVESMKRDIQRIIFDANMHDTFHADYPHAVNSSKRKAQLEEAIDILSMNPTLFK